MPGLREDAVQCLALVAAGIGLRVRRIKGRAVTAEDMTRLRAEFQQQGMTPVQATKATALLLSLVATLERLKGNTGERLRQ